MKTGNFDSRDDSSEARQDLSFGDFQICLEHDGVGIHTNEFIEVVAEGDEILLDSHGLETQILKSSLSVSLLVATLFL